MSREYEPISSERKVQYVIGYLITAGLVCVVAYVVFIALFANPLGWRNRSPHMTLHQMRQLAYAMHDFHDQHDHLPWPDGDAKDKISKLSWRVQILPYIQEKHLYEQFRHDEAWNHPHNLALVDQMPVAFRSERFEPGTGKTCFVIPITPEIQPGVPDLNYRTMFVKGRTTDLEWLANRDGTSETIMILEVQPEHAVIWTKPDDWIYNPLNPSYGLHDGDDGTVNIALADSSVDRLDLRDKLVQFKQMIEVESESTEKLGR